MPIIKDLYKIFCEGSKAWAYAKLCQKTGMAPPDIDIWLDTYKNFSHVLDKQADMYLKKIVHRFKPPKQLDSPTQLKLKTTDFKQTTKDIKQIASKDIRDKIINSFPNNKKLSI